MFVRLLSLVAILLFPSAGLAQSRQLDGAAASLWDHNGSVMRMFRWPDGRLMVAYDAPREGIAELTPRGTLMLTARITGNAVAGMAGVFKKGCSPAGYSVKGRFSADGDELVVRGPTPVRRGCRVVGYRSDDGSAELRFTRLQDPTDGAASPLSSSRPTAGQDQLAQAAANASADRDAQTGSSGLSTCRDLSKIADTMAKATRVSIDPGRKVGDASRVVWETSRWSGGSPVYLIISSSQPVRFKPIQSGYALLPDASAPFGMKFGADESRVIVPLHGVVSDPRGILDITLLTATPTRLQAAVVSAGPGCTVSEARVLSTKTVTPRVQSPSVLLPHGSDVVEKLQYLGSPDGTRVVAIAGEYLSLLEASTLKEMGRFRGKNPVFSPSGRFLTFESIVSRNQNYNTFIFVDMIDAKRVADLDGHAVSWDLKDSYVLVDKFYLGRLEVYNSAMLFNNCYLDAAPYEFNSEARGFEIDLDNNAFVSRDAEMPNGLRIQPLTQCQKSRRYDVHYQRIAQLDEVVSNIVRSFKITPYPAVPDYISEHGRKLFNVAAWLHGEEALKGLFEATDYASKLPGGNRKPLQAFEVSGDRVVEARRGATRSLDMQSTGPRSAESMIALSAGINWTPEATFRRLSDQSTAIQEVSTVRNAHPRLEKVIAQPRQRKRLQSGGGAESSACGSNEGDLFEKSGQRDLVNDVIGHWTFEGAQRLHLVWQRCEIMGPESSSYYNNFHLLDGDRLTSFGRVFDRGTFASFTIPDVNEAIEPTEAYVSWLSTGHAIIADSRHRRMEVVDIKSRRTLHKIGRLAGVASIRSMRLDERRKWLMQVDQDGQLFVYSLAKGNIVLTGRIVDDEVIVWDQANNYVASEEGAHLVKIQFPGVPGSYTFHQFQNKLRLPDLIGRVLRGETTPRVDVGVPPSLDVDFDRTSVSGRIMGRLRKGPFGSIAKVQIYQDGLLTDTVEMSDNAEGSVFDVARLPGTRWVSLLALDADGLASQPVSHDLGPDPRGKSRIVSLAIGIDTFADDKIAPLQGAVIDARRVTEAMAQVSAGRPAESATLIDVQATRDRVLAELGAAVDRIEFGDTLVISYAGHGVRDDAGAFFLTTHDTRISDIPRTAVRWKEVASILRRAKARVLFLLDACHAGAAGTSFFATNDDAAGAVLADVPANIVIFAASKGREFSYESLDGNGGVFSQAFADVVSRERNDFDLNQNGAIEISELFVGVKRKVVVDGRPVREKSSTESGSKIVDTQTPWIARNQMVGDFALF